jgi:hypothetical protein
MQDTQGHYYHEHQNRKQNWRIDAWLRDHGVTSTDLDTHPCVDHMIDLLNIRECLWDRMNRSEQATWGVYWGLVFRNRKQLKPKAWLKFERITQNIINRQLKIQVIRQIATKQDQNKGRNMTANCPDQPDSKLVKQDQLGGREEQELLPWE